MLPYNKVYRLENGKLVQNTKNKIVYTDEKGIKRVKTNPTLKDFAKIGLYPVSCSEVPKFDFETQELQKKIELKDDCYIISYQVKEKEVSENEETGL